MRVNTELQLAIALAELKRRRNEARFMSYLVKDERTGKGASPKQREFWSDRSFGRIILGGNRSGKSMGGAMECVMWAHWSTIARPEGRFTPMGRPLPNGPVYIRAVCPELPSTLDKPHVQRDKLRLITPEHWLRGENFYKAYSVLGHTLHFKNGSLIEFMSAEQATDKHAGQSINAIWFDEEMPQQIYTENIARLDQPLSCWWFTYTPVMGLRWIYDVIYLPALRGEADFKLWQVDTEENESNLGKNFITQMTSTLSDDEKELRLRGRYTMNTGLVYDVFGENAMVSAEVIH